MVRNVMVMGLLLLSADLARAEQKKPSYKAPGLPDSEIAKVAGVWAAGTSDLVSEVDGARVGGERTGWPEVSLAPGRHTLMLRPSASIYNGTTYMLADSATFVARKGDTATKSTPMPSSVECSSS
jgi:hypothetical protein